MSAASTQRKTTTLGRSCCTEPETWRKTRICRIAVSHCVMLLSPEADRCLFKLDAAVILLMLI